MTRADPTDGECGSAARDADGMQEGDKFVRLPEVYVKGNNVRLVYYCAGEQAEEADKDFRSSTYECPTRSSISLPNSRRTISKGTSAADEVASPEEIMAGEGAIEGEAVEVEGAVEEDGVNEQ